MKPISKQRAILLMVLAAFFWSLAGLFIKLIDWHPLVIASIRSGIAGLVMLAFAGQLPKRFSKDVWIGAVCYTILASFFVLSNKLTTSSNAILLQFTSPIWMAILTTFFLKQPLKKKDIFVIVAVMVGMILFFIGDLSFGRLLGNILAILAGVVLAIMILVMKRDPNNNPLHMTLLGSAMLFLLGLPLVFVFPPMLSFQNVSSILILGVFQLGLGYVLFTKALHHVTPLEAVIIPVIEPLFNPIWVFLVIGEKPGKYAFLGGIVVLGTILWKQISDAKEERLNDIN